MSPMEEDTPKQRSLKDDFTPSELLRKSWRLKGDEFILFSSEVLGPFLLDYGFTSAWYFLKTDLCARGHLLPEVQHELVNLIEKNCSKLLDNLLEIETPRDLRDDCRIIGILNYLSCTDSPIPPNISEIALVHRDAIDIYILTSLASRDHTTTLKTLELLGSPTRLAESFTQYLKTLANPLFHRSLRLSGESNNAVSPWADISDLINSLIKVVSKIHDMKYIEAKVICKQILTKLPNLQEALFINRVIDIHMSTEVLSTSSVDIDPLMLYGSESLGISWHQTWDHYKKVENLRRYLISIKEVKAFDIWLYIKAQFMTIQYNYQEDNYEDCWNEIEALNDNIVKHSQYDSFMLTVFATKLEELSKFPSNENNYKDSLLDHMTFIIGLPGPHLTNLSKWIKSINCIAYMNSNDVVNNIGDHASRILEGNYPDSISSLTEVQCEYFRDFYLKNLAFCHGGRKVDRVIDLIPSAFKHLGLLSYLFPKADFIAINPDLIASLKLSFTSLFGFNSMHANATMSELVAFDYDYSVILDSWKQLLGTKLKIINLQGLNIFESNELIKYISKQDYCKIEDCYSCIPKEIELVQEMDDKIMAKLAEFEEDLHDINKRFQSMTP